YGTKPRSMERTLTTSRQTISPRLVGTLNCQCCIIVTDHWPGQQCRGAVLMDPANINSTLIACGLVYGAAQRTDGGDSLVPDPGSKWVIPVYSCASSVTASIKTVTFQYNGTDLSALKAAKIDPK